MIDTLLRRWFPDQRFTAERTESGTSTPVHRVTVGPEIFYLRPGEHLGDRQDAEVAVHRLLRERGLPIPDIVRYEAAPPELDRSATLTTAIPGHPTDLETAPAEVFRQAGRVLAQINAIPIQGYGWVDRIENDILLAEHPTRAAWTVEYQRAAAKLISANTLPSNLAETLSSVIGDWATRPSTGTASLVHGDFDQSHIFVTGEGSEQQFSGIIDFGEIRGADLLYDLGHAFLVTESPARARTTEAFLNGYAEAAPLPPEVMTELRIEAIAIATRWLANMLDRPSNWFRSFLTERIIDLLKEELLTP